MSKKTGAHPSWKPVNLKAVLQGEELDPPPSILKKNNGECLFYPGKVHSLHGESESLKTWIALIAVMELADQGRYSVWIDYEDRASTFVARLKALGMSDDDIGEYAIYIRPDVPLEEEELEEVLKQVEEFNVALVVLDGVTEAMNMHGLDSDRGNQAIAQWLALLPRPLADAGPAVVQIDHVGKNNDGKSNDPIGGQHKKSGLDGAGYLVEVKEPFGRGRVGISLIYVSKDRPGHVKYDGPRRWTATLRIEANEDGTDINWTLFHRAQAKEKPKQDESKISKEMLRECSQYIDKHPGSSPRVVTQQVQGNDQRIRAAIEILIRDEYVASAPNPKGRGEVLNSIKRFGLE